MEPLLTYRGRRLLLSNSRSFRLPLAVLLSLVAAIASALIAAAQQQTEAPREEIVANLAAGRVVIAVVKDAILVATVENPIEVETRPPTPVQLSAERLAVPLGAVDWFSPSAQETLVRIDMELPQLKGHLISTGPHLQQAAPNGGGEASDIEAIGQGVMERLNDVARDLHNKIEQPRDEPLAQLIVAGYLAGYGPEIWQVTFGIEQEQQRGEFWDTRVLRPKYLQFWPPEKGQPHTLVEFAYPPENLPVPLLELVKQKDPRLENLIASDGRMALVASEVAAGDTRKVPAADATQFLRAALSLISPPNGRQTFATIGQETGFAWVLRPPPELTKGRIAKQPSPADDAAPSLLNHPQQ